MRRTAHRTRKYGKDRRGVAILVAISVTAILLILVGGLIAALQFTEGQRGHDLRQARLRSLQQLGLDNAVAMLTNGDQTAPQSWQTEEGTVRLTQLRPADSNQDSNLYKDDHLSVREGDMVAKLAAEVPYKGEAVHLSSTWLMNITQGQERRICVQMAVGRSGSPAMPEEASDSEQ